MEKYERYDPQPIHLFLLSFGQGVGTCLCVEPAHEGDENPGFQKTIIRNIHLKQATSFLFSIDINMKSNKNQRLDQFSPGNFTSVLKKNRFPTKCTNSSIRLCNMVTWYDKLA
jgi:hypothetical protein